MAVDNTALFRARAKMLLALKAAKSKKALVDDEDLKSAVEKEEEMPFEMEEYESAKDRSSASYLGYSTRANEIRSNLTRLRNSVIDKRSSYITAVGHHRCFSLSSAFGMNEWERSAMDDETERAVRHLTQLIRMLKTQISMDRALRAHDEAAHLSQVIRTLESYLKKITKIITELRSVCLKKTADLKRMSRLSTLVKMYEEKVRAEAALERSPSGGDLQKGSDTEEKQRKSASPNGAIPTSEQEGLRRRGHPLKDESEDEHGFVKSNWSVESENEGPTQIDGDLDDGERTQMMHENEVLYAKFVHADSDVLRIEKQLTEIHRLQETLAEKVLEQERDIDVVNEAAVRTVENIKAGNEQIREAIQNIASRRVILLFCIIVLTFTLLFLDWYNP